MQQASILLAAVVTGGDESGRRAQSRETAAIHIIRLTKKTTSFQEKQPKA